MASTLRKTLRDSFQERPLLLAAGVAMLAVLAGASGFVYASPYAPLLVLGGVAALGTFTAWLARPVWALYAALFLVFLPIGLIPANVHSVLNRSVTVFAAGAWFIRLAGARRKIIWTGPALLMVLLLAWSSITLLWAENTSAATNALQVYVLRFLLFLLLIPNEIQTEQDLNGLMNILAASGWVLMLSVVATLMAEGYTAGSRLRVFAENENGAGILGLVAMVGVLWGASRASEHHHKLGALPAAIYIALMVGLAAMSGSRGSALSLMVTLGAFWLWKPLRRWGRLGFLIAILAVVLTPSLFTTLIERFAIEGGDTILGGREVLWQAAWHLVENHPLSGVGIGNAPYESARFLETGLRAVGTQGAAVHNPILAIWSETAIPGIILYLGVLGSALRSFGNCYLKIRDLDAHPLRSYFAAVSCIFLGYMVSWFKGGGMQSDFSYFLILALLILPSVLDVASFEVTPLDGRCPVNKAWQG